MVSVAPKGWMLLLGMALWVLPETGWGQKSLDWPVNSRVYRSADGLPESSCVSVALAPQGKVLTRHPRSGAVSELDGYTVNILPSLGPGNGRVYESPGGQLWTAVADGLEELRDGRWVLHRVPEIAAAFHVGFPHTMDPIPLYPVRQGVVICLLPDRLMEFDSEDPDHARTELLLNADQTRLESFSGMTLARDGGLWIAGARGLLKIPGPVRNLKSGLRRAEVETPTDLGMSAEAGVRQRQGQAPVTQAGSEWHDYLPPEALALHNFQEPHEDEQGNITALAESSADHRKTLVHFDGELWSAEAVRVERVRHAWSSVDKTCWAATIDALFEWNEGGHEVVEGEESATRTYYDVAVEPGGAFWLASSDGLFRYAPLTWRTPAAVRSIHTPIHGLAGDEAAGGLWFVSGSSLHCLQNGRHREYPLPVSSNNVPVVRAIFPLKDGSLLLEARSQCFQFHPESGAFASLLDTHPGGRLKPLGLLRDGRLCLQSFRAGAPEEPYRLEAYDGATFAPLFMPPPEPSFGNDLSTLLAAQNGDLWVSGDRGTAWFHDQKWRIFASADQSTPDSVVAFAELADGRIWCATPDKVWAFDGRDWSAVRVGLDHINAFITSRDGGLWVGTDTGLHRFFQGAWVENGVEEGLPGGGVRELCEDPRGRVWAGTARGLSLYHPGADPDPPQTEVRALTGKGKTIPEGGTLTLRFSGEDKWKYTPSQRLLYSYRLDERDWSAFQEDRTVFFADLPAGKHYFQVRAMDRNCNIDPTPARLEFAVVLPWYKESRLLLIAFAGLGVALFFAGLAFNRHRQLLHSYAEVGQKVAQRTQELEVANRQLLHSEKMNALGTLAAGIAHDFNNILSIVKGSAQIIEDNLDNPQKVRTRVERINTVVEQGAGIVKAMLGFSRDSGEQSGPVRSEWRSWTTPSSSSVTGSCAKCKSPSNAPRGSPRWPAPRTSFSRCC